MTGTYKGFLWGMISLWLMSLSIGIQAQDGPPIVLVIDSSEEVNSQERHQDLYDAIGKVVFFIAAYNPVSIISTCPDTASMESPTQDAAVLRAALSQVAWCGRYDQAQALEKAVTKLGDQTGDVIYLINGQFLHSDLDESLRATAAALTPLQETRSCLYVIPIGNAVADPNMIDRDAVQDLVNAAGCGQRYDGQRTPTLASTVIEAVLVSQGRKLLTSHADQLPLFSRATAKLNRPVTISEDIESVRIDVIWGTGTLEVALEPPGDVVAEPTLVTGNGYHSFTIVDPAPGPWNIKLSVTQVPENQVALVLFSQAPRITAPIQVNPPIAFIPTSQPESAVPSSSSESSVPQATVVESPAAASPTAEMDMPISATFAAPTAVITEASPITATPLPTSPTVSASSPAGDLLPVFIGLGVVGGLGVLLFWRQRHQNPSVPPGGTLHSRATAELPPLPFNPNTPLHASDKRRAVQMHAPVPTGSQFEEAFRQFPAVVVFKNGPRIGQVFEVDSSYFVIGRHSTSDLRIQDGTVSREHARITFDNAQNLYVIENVSQAGTQVNGQFITQRRPLYSGDLIQVGNIQIHFQLRVPPSI